MDTSGKKIILRCVVCGKEFTRPPSVIKRGKGRYCSQSCANGKPRSIEKQVKANGYVYIKSYNHPFRSKQNLVAEHRLIIERAIGRFLVPKEVPHHIDENKINNELYNLFLCQNDNEHRQIHKVDPVFLHMFNVARYQHWDELNTFDVTKNRQDQLQEMIGSGWRYAFSSLMWWYSDVDIERLERTGSMEQLWLAFVMKEKFGKIWNGEEWING